ncbi:DNA-directed RNA polymerase subunit beta' [Candidatus Berkelbacteria bacterium]|nr:DNA-directed RNA polymerase subunit beta' [Candidatus Berkelbacteria bacterium]
MAERAKRNSGAIKLSDFNAVRISVASPEKILQWSYGEVLKPETINYRTQKPERDGLFDERIFGPTKDWECYCGKYKKIRYKGVVCDKCGVEVTRSSVRRERMGHIELASAVAHIWYVRGVPSVLSQVLDLSISDIEKIIYFAGFIILDVDEELRADLLEQLDQEYESLKDDKKAGDESQLELDTSYKKTKQELTSLSPKTILSEVQYQHLSLKYGNVIRVGIGAESLLELLRETDLKSEIDTVRETIEEVGETTRKKLLKRLKVLADLHKAKIDPVSLILTRIPVIPPDLRPMVQLDGGRFAASDLNDLYRRVLNRNNRLKKLLAQGAPEVICRNEKRMLQEAVDALIDNSARRNRAVSAGASQRRLRSLSDMLRGKQGRFRQNLLGKRVDYSGRSVIVVGPELKLNQCGLPKTMALELFKPFVISELVSQGYIQNVKNASRLIENGAPEVWDVLEQVTKEKYVLLNRAPTLHRLGIQAFKPVLIEGKAIQLHPLVCYAYNADFDGDQMAVHVPLSAQSIWEAGEIMQSSKNLLKPASGEPVVSPRLDMVFGCYYLTSYEDGVRGEGKFFSGKNEAILAYQMGNLHVRAKVKVKMRPNENSDPELFETSVGRILFNNVIPKELRFRNETMGSKNLKRVVNDCFVELGVDETSQMVDRIKDLGYEHALRSGMTFAIGDVNIPNTKNDVVGEITKSVEQTHDQYMAGLISDEERRIQTITAWNKARDQIGVDMQAQIDPNSPVFIAAESGARGSPAQLNQMGGMKGLVVNPAGDIIETPIISNYKEGLSELEYFISTHGARKGKADTALRTSDAGYLTRRLVDVSQDVITTEHDCEAAHGLEVTRAESEELGIDYATRLAGRVAFKAIKSGSKQLVAKGKEITNEAAATIQADAKIDSVAVRSPIYCESDLGICQLCYGRDLATGQLVEVGEVVGIMAAQAIGEPGTQLTLKTFHTGGVSGEDITTGLPRVDELFESRSPKSPAIMSDIDGRVRIRDKKTGRVIEVAADQVRKEDFELEEGFEPKIKNGELVKAKQIIASNEKKKTIRANFSGKVKITSKKITVEATEPLIEEYNVAPNKTIKVKNGDVVVKSQPLTEGHLDLQKLLKHQGIEQAQRYIISGIQQIYLSQGQEINDKHIEIILRQMFSKSTILDEGDSKHIVGQIVDRYALQKEQKKLKDKGKEVPVAEPMILGVTRVALTTKSFLSAASFQETTSVLINAAIKGAKDDLRGLKENVIIGRLIPAGTGFKGKKK